MIQPCPHCGWRPNDFRLMVDATQRSVSRGLAIVRLSPVRFDLFAALLQAYPDTVPNETLFRTAFDRGAPDSRRAEFPSRKTLAAHLSLLRRDLLPLELTVEPYWYEGYSLTAPQHLRDDLAAAAASIRRRPA